MKKKFKQSGVLYAILIFILIAVFSYLARKSFYDYYLVRQVDDVFAAVLAQTFIVSVFWMASLSGVILFYLSVKRRIRTIPIIVWALFFLINVVFWFANLKFVYFSGVEINPFLTSQAEGSGGMIINVIKGPLIFVMFFYAIAVGALLKLLVHRLKKTRQSVWLFSLLGLAGLAILRITPARPRPKTFCRWMAV